MEDKCVICNDVIPEGRMVCPQCENKQIKMGMILQSNHATDEEVKKAYNFIEWREERANEED